MCIHLVLLVNCSFIISVEEPDYVSSSVPNAQPNTAKFLASAASIELNWYEINTRTSVDTCS